MKKKPAIRELIYLVETSDTNDGILPHPGRNTLMRERVTKTISADEIAEQFDPVVTQKTPWVIPMISRHPEQEHRSATPLELFYDLCFVVAVSFAAGRLHHALVERHYLHAVTAYCMVFFAVWWAWMNFTWFASAYDTDDRVYRLTTFVQIAGALTVAAGMTDAFDSSDFTLATAGYVILRAGMIAHWIRAAMSDPLGSIVARRFAIGLFLVQSGWVLRLLLPREWGVIAFLGLVVVELAIPVIAERPRKTTWHPVHIAERYGLFTLIVLGEVVTATAVAIQPAIADNVGLSRILTLAGTCLLVVFSMWWRYFDTPLPVAKATSAQPFVWGYSHLVVFASAAAIGGGLQACIELETHATNSLRVPWMLSLPLALYFLAVGALRLWGSNALLSGRAASFLALVATVAVLPIASAPLLLSALGAIVLAAFPFSETQQIAEGERKS